MAPHPTAPHIRMRPKSLLSSRELITALSANGDTGAPRNSLASMQQRIQENGLRAGTATSDLAAVPASRICGTRARHSVSKGGAKSPRESAYRKTTRGATVAGVRTHDEGAEEHLPMDAKSVGNR